MTVFMHSVKSMGQKNKLLGLAQEMEQQSRWNRIQKEKNEVPRLGVTTSKK